MQTYEINLWLDKKIIEKIVKQFEKDEDVMAYIKVNFDTAPSPEFPSLDPTRGYTRPKASKYIITWAKVHTYVRKKGPTRIELSEDEKEIQKTLEASITREAIDEWGHNEMLREVRKEYWSHPDAKGLEEKNKEGLTPKQKKFYDVIKEFVKANGYAPSYEEMKQMNGMHSKSQVHGYVHRLIARGWLKNGNGRNRSISIV